ncbi:MAG: hypothetical protein ACRCTQ_01915 [Brevinemataceae bacterium]
MRKDVDMRMEFFIKAMLVKEGFCVFTPLVEDQGCDLIIKNVLDNGICQFIQIRILSRVEEYNIIIDEPAVEENNHFYYYILHSVGINKCWLLRADELIKLRSQGLDDRDTGPYLVKHFQRLTMPDLTLEQFKNRSV